MKKYLLLATTAMLFSTNAMAATYDDASATVHLKAAIGQGCTFTNADDMDFKTILLKPGTGESVSFDMSSDGAVSTSSERVITYTQEGTPGSVTVSCPTGVTATLEDDCADGYEESSGACIFDGGYAHVSTPSDPISGTKTVTFGGSLTITDNIGTISVDEPIFKLTLSY